MTLRLTSVFLGFALLSGLLTGCASIPAATALSGDPGPTFLLEGRMSIRRPGKQTTIASFTWARGYLADGWTERINLTDKDGMRIMRMVGTADGVTVTTPRQSYRHSSFEAMLDREVGIRIPPALLAGWLVNQHDGGELPSELILDNLQVKVLDRRSNGYPQRLRIVHNDTVVLIAITDEI